MILDDLVLASVNRSMGILAAMDMRSGPSSSLSVLSGHCEDQH